MPFNNIVQPDIVEIDENFRLRKTDESEKETSLPCIRIQGFYTIPRE